MIEHRAAVREKLVDQEAEGLRKLNLGRDQILARLWELATLSHEVTRGIIAGQIKALSMIVAIEGLIPDRRLSPSRTQPAAPPVGTQTSTAPGGSANSSTKPQLKSQAIPLPPRKPNPPRPRSPTRSLLPVRPPSWRRRAPSALLTGTLTATSPALPTPSSRTALNWVPHATDSGFDALLDRPVHSGSPFP